MSILRPQKILFKNLRKIENLIDEFSNCEEDNLKRHLNLRDKLYYKKKNLNIDEEKDALYKDIIAVTEQIKNIRKEIRFFGEIMYNLLRKKVFCDIK